MKNLKSKKEIANDYDRIFSGDGLREEMHYYRFILSIIGELKDKTLLDVACGEGILLAEAEKKGALTFGVDISQEALKKAGKNSPDSNLILGDGEKVAFNCEFDYVTCLGSMEHYRDPALGCREIVRLLTKQGRAVIILPNKFSMHTLLDVLFKGKPGDEGFQVIEQTASLQEWRGFLEQNGLKVSKVYKYNQRPAIFKNGKIRSVKKFIRNVFFYYMTPLCFARSFIFLCRKKQKGNTYD